METTHSLYRAHLFMLDYVLINKLMNSSDYFINMQFVKYISGWFDFRVVDLITK